MIGQADSRTNGFLLLVALLASACSSGGQGPSLEPRKSPADAQTPTQSLSPGPLSVDLAKGCPLTPPRPWDPPPGVSPDALFGSETSYGNGMLWVGGLGENGVIVATPFCAA